MGKRFLSLATAVLAVGAQAAPLMSEDWTAHACKQWNATPGLVDELGGDWVKNHGGKGHKVIQLYRTDCGATTRTELRIAPKDGKAVCVYGGKRQSATLDSSVDYLMHAETAHWGEMGRGQYGPMRAMMFGALQFDGPRFEAMSVMGPFENFLLLVGKVASETKACPGK